MSGPAFLTPLRAELVTERPREWRLIDPLVFRSDYLNLEITAPAGFLTDFASVPRLPFAFMLAGDRAPRAATVHDWLYKLGAVPEVDRATADQVFLEAMIAEGIEEDLRTKMYLAVEMFGGPGFKRERTLQ